MPAIETTARISAPPRIVAEVLFNFKDFPNWNPFIRSLKADNYTTSSDGEYSRPSIGSTLEGRLVLAPGWDAQTVAPIVTRCDEKELEWQGSIGHRYLLGALHRFSWEPVTNDENATSWVHSEEFLGLFAWPFYTIYGATLRATFESMNEKLKELAEAKFLATQS